MARISIRDLKTKYNISQEDIDFAKDTQEARRAAGAPFLPLAVLLGVQKPGRRAIGVDRALKIVNTKERKSSFFKGGNVSLAFDYHDAVTERLFEVAPTTTKAKEALSVLWTICRYLGWESYECTKNATELGKITRTKNSNMSNVLKLLEAAGAIQRVRRGNVKIITITPEGAYRGKIENHGAVTARYALEVIEGGKSGD